MMLDSRWHEPEQRDRLARSFRERGFAYMESALEADVARELVHGIEEISDRNAWFQASCGDPYHVQDTPAGHTLESRAAHFSYRYDQFPLRNVPVRSIVGAGRFSSRRDIRVGLDEAGQTRANSVIEDPMIELDRDNSLHRLKSWLGATEFAGLVAAITGTPVGTEHATATITRYKSGHFLALHTDGTDERLCAFILQLTRFWLPHWGGNLLVYDHTGQYVEHTFVPRFNTLLLLAVPRLHTVTSVAPTCERSRYACTGWVYPKRLGMNTK